MPEHELLAIQDVQLTPPIKTIVSRAGVRVNCAACGEEIINEREVVCEGEVRCRACAGQSYYQLTASALPALSHQPPNPLPTPLLAAHWQHGPLVDGE